MWWIALIASCLDATVSSTDDPPQVTWISPVDGAAFVPGELFNLCAQIADEDALDDLSMTVTSSIDEVIWTQDQGLSACPGGNLGMLLSLSDADHTLLLTAIDTRGRAGQAALDLVADTNAAPWCDLQTPRDGHEVALGDSVLIEAQVGDGESDETELTATIESNMDGLIWTGSPNGVGAITAQWTPSQAGDHTLTLWVVDPRNKAHACESLVIVDPCLDQDLDGFSSCTGDCDDDDDASYPEAPEQPDGNDNDCDDITDEGTTLYDDDGDGFSEVDGDCDDTDSSVYPEAPEIAHDGIDQDCNGGDEIDSDDDGYTGVESGGVDCDDTDPEIYPGAEEIWYDGVDQDCEGDSDLDADADGFDSDDYGGDDCDDQDLLIYPGATELWYDGVDGDCDGWSDDDADGDGHDASEQGGDDCNDSDATVSPSASESRDGLDNNCDGACDEGLIDAGDLIVTEVMKDPDSVSDSSGEWFEVFNPTTIDIAICSDWTFADEDVDSFAMPSETTVLVPAGGYAVFARETDTSSNGGLTADHGYATGMQLANGADELILLHGGTEIDHIAYDDGDSWPDPTGASISLDPSALDGTDNDAGENWCTGTSVYGDGDRGTPGTTNDGC
jgi:hypothetical protein